MRGDAGSHDHVAELRRSRVGKDALDVVLLSRHQRREHGGGDADASDDELRIRRRGNQESYARKHVNTGGDHRRGVDQSRDWRRTFHRIWQPHVKRELRGLTHRAAED